MTATQPQPPGTRPARAELRHTVLARLSAHTAEVEWAGTGAHIAFADSIVDFADWLARCEQAVPARGPGASRTAIEEAKRAAREAVAAARERREVES